jgi:hypothetical protein
MRKLRRSNMIKLGALTTAAVIAVGMCSLPTDASAARGGAHFGGGHMGGAAHFGGGARFGGGVAHFGGPRVAGNIGGWDRGYRGYGVRRYGYGGGYALGGWSDNPAYASCYIWTPLGYVNQCGYGYNYYW